MQRAGVTSIEPRPEAQAQFIAETDALLAPTVWNAGGCSSWYLDETGRNSTIWPGFTVEYWARTRRARPGDYAVMRRRPDARAVILALASAIGYGGSR